MRMSKIVNFLVSMKTGCLSAYEVQVWSEVNNFNNYSLDRDRAEHTDSIANKNESTDQKGDDPQLTRAHLRNLRNNIYERIQKNLSLHWHIRNYSCITEDFLDRHKSELSVDDMATLRNRVRLTEKAVRKSKFKRTKFFKPNFSNKKHPGPGGKITKPMNDIQTEPEKVVLDLEPIDSKSHVSEVKHNHVDKVIGESSDINILTELKSSDDLDYKLLILPDVPSESPSSTLDIFGDDLDQEISRRLTRLKFFSQTWALNKN